MNVERKSAVIAMVADMQHDTDIANKIVNINTLYELGKIARTDREITNRGTSSAQTHYHVHLK